MSDENVVAEVDPDVADGDYYEDDGEDLHDQEPEEQEQRPSDGGDQQAAYGQDEQDDYWNWKASDKVESEERFASFDQGPSDNYYYDDDDDGRDSWPSYMDDDADFGEDVDLEEESGDFEGEEDTIAHSQKSYNSPVRSSKGKGSERNSEFSRRMTGKKEGPVEIGKRSFRWFERKILAHQVPHSEENLRRKLLLEKCQLVRKVSKPVVVTLLGAKQKRSSAASGKLGHVTIDARKESRQSIGEESQNEGELPDKEEEDENDLSRLSGRSKSFRKDFSEQEWAMKNAIDFLTTEGCTSSSSRSYKSSLKAAREEVDDFRLTLYEKQLQRRRMAVGNATAVPEITAALQRHAERAVWRAVIDNTKPRYPLPRFILPRHRYLKKVQEQFIGPGSYELDVFEKQSKLRQSRLPSTWRGCKPRFPKEDGEDGSKDGSGGGGGGGGGGVNILDPWKTLDAANFKHKYPGTYIPFESTPKNFRQGLLDTGSRVPPNAYNIKSPLEEFIKKKTSTRGPYDCYTPSRGVIPYGYHQSKNDEEQSRLGPGSYEVRTSLLNKMHDSYNAFKGLFEKAERNKMFGFKAAFDHPLWPKEDESMPAVGQYDPDIEAIGQDHEQEMAPFKVQTGLKKRDPKKPDLVAPDYYFYGFGSTWTVPPRGANLASVFRSRTPQIMPPKEHHIRKERNKSSNKKLDLEGLAKGFHLEEHFAFDPSYKHTYVLEDCKDPCLKPKGGPRVDPYAIPGYGVVGNVTGTERGRVGGCCGC